VVDRPTASCRLVRCRGAWCRGRSSEMRLLHTDTASIPGYCCFLGPFFSFNSEPINLPPTLQVRPNRHRCRQAGSKREALKVDGMTSATCERKIPCRDMLVQPLNAALEPSTFFTFAFLQSRIGMHSHAFSSFNRPVSERSRLVVLRCRDDPRLFASFGECLIEMQRGLALLVLCMPRRLIALSSRPIRQL